MSIWRRIPALAHIMFFLLSDREGWRLIRKVKQTRLTYLSNSALIDLRRAVSLVEKEKISGLIIEAGCALGGSALILAASKAEGRRMEIYDTFEAIPAPTEADGEFALERYVDIVNGQSVGINGDVYYGYQGDLLPKVISNFTEYGYKPDQTNVFFIKGLYSEQLRISQPVALAHIDCDWYESVMVCLERIEPFMIPGSRLVIDDYGYYAGCTKAVDEYFSLRKTGYQFIQKSRLHIVKC